MRISPIYLITGVLGLVITDNAIVKTEDLMNSQNQGVLGLI